MSCSDSFKVVSPVEYNGKFPDESAKNIRIIFSDMGKVNFIIKAAVLNKYLTDTNYMDCPEGVEIIAYDADENVQSILTANYAVSNDLEQIMEARDHVVLQDMQKGDRIETEKIIWDKKRRKIYSNMEVRRIKADGTVDIGDGFESDEKFSKYAIRNIRAENLVEL